MNINKEKINLLRNKIISTLTPLVNKNYVLLDIPNHRNIGDTLIWEGEIEFLKSLPYNLLYTCNSFTYLHGGGNFGDVWRNTQEFRNNVVREKKNNKIIIFPQTVHYENNELLIEDSNLYNSHPDLTICARDTRSYEILKQNFHNCNILLLPDMAFCLNFENQISSKKTKKTLFLKRLDKEVNEKENTILNRIKNKSSLEIKDWPGFFENGTLKRRLQGYSILIETKLSKFFINSKILSPLVDDVYGLKRRDNKERLIKFGIDFINQYDEIYSTRLHGFILAILLGKEVSLIDNSYGKNSTFFESWIYDFQNVNLIKD